MTPTQRYSLASPSGVGAQALGSAALLDAGRATGVKVSGCLIEAQYATPLGTLLITSYDCPFEEANSFVLLDERHAELARAALGAPYASFLLLEHWPVDALTLALHYAPDVFYTLRIAPPQGWRRTLRLQLQAQTDWAQDARMRASCELRQARVGGGGAPEPGPSDT